MDADRKEPGKEEVREGKVGGGEGRKGGRRLGQCRGEEGKGSATVS